MFKRSITYYYAAFLCIGFFLLSFSSTLHATTITQYSKDIYLGGLYYVSFISSTANIQFGYSKVSNTSDFTLVVSKTASITNTKLFLEGIPNGYYFTFKSDERFTYSLNVEGVYREFADTSIPSAEYMMYPQQIVLVKCERCIKKDRSNNNFAILNSGFQTLVLNISLSNRIDQIGDEYTTTLYPHTVITLHLSDFTSDNTNYTPFYLRIKSQSLEKSYIMVQLRQSDVELSTDILLILIFFAHFVFFSCCFMCITCCVLIVQCVRRKNHSGYSSNMIE